MSTHNVCFGLEIRKLFFCYALLTKGLYSLLWLTPCPLGNFPWCFCRLLIFPKSTFSKKFFQEYLQNVKQFGCRSGLTKCLGPNCLQRLSADDTRSRQKINSKSMKPYGPAHEIFVLITYTHKLPLNVHAVVSSKARGLNLFIYTHNLCMPAAKALATTAVFPRNCSRHPKVSDRSLL